VDDAIKSEPQLPWIKLNIGLNSLKNYIIECT